MRNFYIYRVETLNDMCKFEPKSSILCLYSNVYIHITKAQANEASPGQVRLDQC